MALVQFSRGPVEITGQRDSEPDVHRVDTSAEREAELFDECQRVRGGAACFGEVALHGEQQCTNVQRERLVGDVCDVAAHDEVAERDPLPGRCRSPRDRAKPRDQRRALQCRVSNLPGECSRPLQISLPLAGPAEHEASHSSLRVRAREIGKIAGLLQR